MNYRKFVARVGSVGRRKKEEGGGGWGEVGTADEESWSRKHRQEGCAFAAARQGDGSRL